MDYDHDRNLFHFTVFTREDEEISTILGLVFAESFNGTNVDYVLMNDENPIPFDMHKYKLESAQDAMSNLIELSKERVNTPSPGVLWKFSRIPQSHDVFDQQDH